MIIEEMRYILAFLLATLATVHVDARKMPVQHMYMFGMAAAFTDTIVYFTPIQQVDSAWIDSKSKFLQSRDNYSYQLRDYLANQLQMPHRTCVLIYEQDRRKLEKKYLKMKQLYTNPKPGAQHYDVRYLTDEDFHFRTIDEAPYLETENEGEEPVKPRKRGRK
jgi:hypothetical protein